MSVQRHSSRLSGIAYTKAINQTARESVADAIDRAQRRANSTGKAVAVFRRVERYSGSPSRKRVEYGLEAQVLPDSRNPSRRKNPTKAQKREKTRKVSAKRRVAVALKNFLTKANPAGKYAGAKMQRNKGGSITIIPIKLRRAK
jgi:flavin-binding protein dodecin